MANYITTPEMGNIAIKEIQGISYQVVHGGKILPINDIKHLSEYSGDDKIISFLINGRSYHVYHTYSNATFGHMNAQIVKSLKRNMSLNLMKAEKLFAMRDEKPSEYVRAKVKKSMYIEFHEKCHKKGLNPTDVIRKLVENFTLSDDDDYINIDEEGEE